MNFACGYLGWVFDRYGSGCKPAHRVGDDYSGRIGNGSTFSLDEDGGLRTTRTLDFEQMSSYSLSVHALDPYGGMMGKKLHH